MTDQVTDCISAFRNTRSAHKTFSRLRHFLANIYSNLRRLLVFWPRQIYPVEIDPTLVMHVYRSDNLDTCQYVEDNVVSIFQKKNIK